MVYLAEVSSSQVYPGMQPVPRYLIIVASATQSAELTPMNEGTIYCLSIILLVKYIDIHRRKTNIHCKPYIYVQEKYFLLLKTLDLYGREMTLS